MTQTLSESGSGGALDKFRGCLLGVAIGDALGAPVEFLSDAEIRDEFGAAGITGMHDWAMFPAGSFTDDTQMTISTARGILDAYADGAVRDVSEVRRLVHERYLEWHSMQENPSERRGPGLTCMRALASGRIGTTGAKINDSKGCGGVMRVAPAGLAYPPDSAAAGPGAFLVGAELAAITHGHPSGYLSAGFLAELVSLIVRGKNILDALTLAIPVLHTWEAHEETMSAITSAMVFSGRQVPPGEAVAALGEGWVGEEALAIAIYCALSALVSAANPEAAFTACAINSANHGGDSDSTASIACGLLGAHFGESSVPAEWLDVLERRQELESLAGALFDMRIDN